MPQELSPFTEAHLKDAAELVCLRYANLLERCPFLPDNYSRPDVIIRLLKGISSSGSGIAALQDNNLVGFMSAWRLASYRGSRAVFSPEWAHAVLEPGGRRIYETMYASLAATWNADGYQTHLVSFFADDASAIECWQWLGFGMIALDAIRDLRPVNDGDNDIQLRRAGIEDIGTVVRLNDSLRRHTEGSPIFLAEETSPDSQFYIERLNSDRNAVWLALKNEVAVAFLVIGPASEDACTIIVDDTTASITGAFTMEAERGTGIGSKLVGRALEWARERGYARCAVDFEPMNYWARRFWLRYFEPVCYTFARRTDL